MTTNNSILYLVLTSIFQMDLGQRVPERLRMWWRWC